MDFSKLNNVIKPMNLSFWKDLQEECGGCGAACSCAGTAAAATSVSSGTLGATPTPALTSSFANGSQTRVNGILVGGKSVKKKKKKKKNEATFSGIVIEQEEIDNFNFQDVKTYFQQHINQQEVYNYCLQDKIKIIGKTWSKTANKIKSDAFFLMFKQLDYILETAYGKAEKVVNSKQRDDDITGWYYLYNTVLFGQDLIQVKLDIAEGQIGKKIYYIRKPKNEALSGVPLSTKYSHVNRNKTSSINIILEDDENVNPYGLIPGKEYDLTPYFHITLLEQKPLEEAISWIDSDGIERTEIDHLIPDTTWQEEQKNKEYWGNMDSPEKTFASFKGNTDDRDFEDALNILQFEYGEDAKKEYQDFIDNFIRNGRYADYVTFAKQKGYSVKDLSVENVGKYLEEDVNDIIFQEDFHEAYEKITGLLAKQLDRMNFEFANTEEIIYKKEGKYKYLLKFDNENGFLKFNISQDGNIIWEKEWQLDEKDDVTPIFQEIEDVYNQYGI